MSEDDVVPFPPLPNELIHQILKLAAGSSRFSALSLYLVASWVNPLVLPQLLSTVVIRSREQASLFNDYISQPPTQPGFRVNVASFARSLWLSGATLWRGRGAETVVPLFEQCTKLSRLAILESGFLSLLNSPSPLALGGGAALEESGLQVTILDERDVLGRHYFFSNKGDPGGHIFRRITHLFLTNPLFYDEVDIAHYSRLTHFAILWNSPNNQRLDELKRITLPMQSLKMIVVVFSTLISRTNPYRTILEDWVRECRKTDKRIYILDSPDIFQDWEEEAEGGASIWEKAVMFTGARGLLG